MRSSFALHSSQSPQLGLFWSTAACVVLVSPPPCPLHSECCLQWYGLLSIDQSVRSGRNPAECPLRRRRRRHRSYHRCRRRSRRHRRRRRCRRQVPWRRGRADRAALRRRCLHPSRQRRLLGPMRDVAAIRVWKPPLSAPAAGISISTAVTMMIRTKQVAMSTPAMNNVTGAWDSSASGRAMCEIHEMYYVNLQPHASMPCLPHVQPPRREIHDGRLPLHVQCMMSAVTHTIPNTHVRTSKHTRARACLWYSQRLHGGGQLL